MQVCCILVKHKAIENSKHFVNSKQVCFTFKTMVAVIKIQMILTIVNAKLITAKIAASVAMLQL